MTTSISNRVDIVTVLDGIKTDIGIPSSYSHFSNGEGYPHLVYMGSGQSQLIADGSAYWRANTYRVEFYYLKKDEALESSIEDAFLSGGWNYSKSDDTYIDDEGIFVIYYMLS